jgi:AbrB family looped-hinge helix DNA binding protein
MRMTSKGQVTIPKHVRESAGIKPGVDLAVVYERGEIKIKREVNSKNGDASMQYAAWLKRVRGVATANVTTAEILAATRGRDHGIRSR